MVVIRAVQSKLRPQEECVYSRAGGFTLPDQSVVGTHTLYITNQGRILAHDTGGLFGNEQVEIYEGADLGVKVTLDKYSAELTNEAGYSRLTFSFTMRPSEFITLFSKTKKSMFRIPSAAPYRCYMRDAMGLYTFAELRLKPEAVLLGGSEIPFRRIKDLSIDPNCMAGFSGIFEIGGKEVQELHLFLPYISVLKQLVESHQHTPKVSELVGEKAALFPVRVSGTMNNVKYEDVSLTLAAEENRLRFVNETDMQVVGELSREMDAFYYAPESHQLFAVKGATPLRIKLLQEQAQAFIQKRYVQAGCSAWPDAGKLYGVWDGKRYEGAAVDLLASKDTLRFQIADSMRLTKEIPYGELESVTDDRKWFFLHKRQQIALLALNSGVKLSDSAVGKRVPRKQADEAKVGHLANLQPFYFDHTREEFAIYQSADSRLQTFAHTELNGISIVEPGMPSPFAKVRLDTAHDKAELYIPYAEVQGVIQRSYLYKKSPLLPQLQGKQLFLSWGRMANDFTLYQLFGQLITLSEGIRELHTMKQSAEQRSTGLINLLYHGIQAQKKRMDLISIYLPALLEQEDRKLLEQAGIALSERPYKQFQQRMIGIASQLRRSLSEIENALSAVSFAIIPKVEMDKYIDAKANKRYVAAAGLGTAGLLFPPLLLPAGFMAIQAYFMKGDMKMQEEIRLKNEKHRMDFYLHKALDSFDHMMKTVYPYYIAECNRAMYEMMRQVASAYKPGIEEPPVKQALLERLAQYYTYKQMPIDDSVAVNRHELIEKVHGASQLNEVHISSIRQEVGLDVSQSVSLYR